MPLYVRCMKLLYGLCMGIAGFAIICMTIIIAWSVYTRYWLSEGSFWAEPIAIMLAVQMTFFGAAACYRMSGHISIDVLVRLLPDGPARWAADRIADAAVLILGLAMIWYGIGLVQTTWMQVYPEFQHIKVGVVYTALPLSGLVTVLFAIERFLLGPAVIGDEAAGTPEEAH